jgi:DNA (cytosine-5)-methyltransferase 1
MTRPRLLDLFCGAGGAGMGYHRAGFDVVGVDLAPQPRYPFEFHQADALEFLAAHGHEFDAIHASPPCQGYSAMRCLPWLKDREYPMLIDPTREGLIATGKPWVIENVERAPLHSGMTLCGLMFGLKVYRHRRFESSVLMIAPPHQKHPVSIGPGRMLNDRAVAHPDGFVSLLSKGDLAVASAAMGIDWMSRDELAESIPPAYTEYIGRQLMAAIESERDAA